MNKSDIPREGSLYKIINVADVTFRIIYGYYEESERDKVEPLPVFPDLKKKPIYTSEGKPIVTAVQEPCQHYIPINKENREDWCSDCIYYLNPDEEISICDCMKNRR